MLWLCGLAMLMCFLGAYVFRDIPDIRNWLVAGGLFPVGVACIGFVGFAVFKPEKLQSEEYQIRHESLQVIQQKSGRLTVAPGRPSASIIFELCVLKSRVT